LESGLKHYNVCLTKAGYVTRSPTHQLLEFVLAEDARAAMAAHLFCESGSWGAAIQLAKTWKVIPRLHERIRALGLRLTPADSATLKAEFLRTYQKSAFRAATAIGAIQALEQAGIPVVAFKGLASIAVLYGDSKHRAIQDAEILIPRDDLPKVLACLEQKGFKREGPETLAQYVRFVQDSPGFAGNQAVTVCDEHGCEMDVHWELAGSGLRPKDILGRSTKCELMKSTIPVVDARDAFVLTIHHAIRENFAIESVCRDLLDFQRWLRHFRETGRWEQAMTCAAESRCKVAALTMATLVSSYDGAADSTDAAAWLSKVASPSEQRSATSLKELFHYQLSHGRLGKDVFYLVHSRPWRQILRGLATDWSGYRRSMQTLEQKLGEKRPLHERVAHLARSMPGLRELRLARELACIKFGAN
jgi:hypothetical protein